MLMTNSSGISSKRGFRVCAAKSRRLSQRNRRPRRGDGHSVDRRLGVGRDVIACIEAGRRKVEVSDLIMIGGAFGGDPVDLFGRLPRW
jgi:hypothetical protein